jgi:hypothetical protein
MALAGRAELMRIQASELSVLPPTHNRMPIKGILTRVGAPSDSAPSGSPGGRRVLLSAAAARLAIPSLIAMPVGVAADFRSQSTSHRIGAITDAYQDGDAIHIEAEFWPNDFPSETKRIKAEQAKLGMSFEAVSCRDGNLIEGWHTVPPAGFWPSPQVS